MVNLVIFLFPQADQVDPTQSPLRFGSCIFPDTIPAAQLCGLTHSLFATFELVRNNVVW